MSSSLSLRAGASFAEVGRAVLLMERAVSVDVWMERDGVPVLSHNCNFGYYTRQHQPGECSLPTTSKSYLPWVLVSWCFHLLSVGFNFKWLKESKSGRKNTRGIALLLLSLSHTL